MDVLHCLINRLISGFARVLFFVLLGCASLFHFQENLKIVHLAPVDLRSHSADPRDPGV